MFNVFMIDCHGGSSSYIEVMVKDTEENWGKTADHCANILIKTERDESGTEVMETRTYALLGDIDMKTLTFYRL
jgi:hypothetical protein